MSKQGLFLTLEGPDGGGKTTQAEKISQWFQLYGRKTIVTREPGGTELAEQLREFALDPDRSLSPKTEALLQLSARADHVDQVIRPALSAGKVVICDRFGDSTLVYQGVLGGLDLLELRQLGNFATDHLVPDLTILLDGDPEALLLRRRARGAVDKFELAGLDFQNKVRQGYLALAKEEPERFFVVDALQNVAVITAEIVKRLERYK